MDASSAGVFRWILAVAFVLAGDMEFSAAADPVAFTPDAIEFFERDVRPLLAARCWDCHGRGKKIEGGLRLDSRGALLAGGDSGPAAIERRPDESLLLQAVRYDGPVQMPPAGKLSDAEQATLRQWVSAGMPWPDEEPVLNGTAPSQGDRSQIADEDRRHWSFSPLVEPPVPDATDDGWSRTAIDRFIQEKLRAAGLSPAPDADKRTWLRRATFTLTGLPPTEEELADFLADESDTASESVVDRLLASPHHAEKFARHWLDVVRFADSSGKDENHAHGAAWRYRDWAVDAFARDLSFDRFVAEQIAGDLLPPRNDGDRWSGLVATGFLQVGPKALAEQDKPKLLFDIADEQLDTLGKAFLGLTIGCARCHDHKLEPIPTRDYYAMAGILRGTRTMGHLEFVSTWLERPLAEPSIVEADRLWRVRFDGLVKSLDERKKSAGETPSAEDAYAIAESSTAKAEFEPTRPPEIPYAMAVDEGEVGDMAIAIRGNHLNRGAVVPRGFLGIVPVESSPSIPPSHSGRAELAGWLVDKRNPLPPRVMANRAWSWCFGPGLVRTPDNLGLSGDRPVHGELLDWLACRLRETGSIRLLVREIVLSRTFATSWSPDDSGDPDHRLFQRRERRRLSAEELRDAWLFVSGRLDRRVGGSVFNYANREPHVTYYKGPVDYSAPRRTIYLPVVRNARFELFDLFDHPDPSTGQGTRAETAVAPQALLLMNSPLVLDAARDLGHATTAESPAESIARTYRRVLLRDPAPEEVASALAFISDVEATLSGEAKERCELAWQAWRQTLLIGNEFLHVE